jgi:hypothetical protein
MAALPAAIYLFDLYTLPRAVAASAIAVPVYLTVMYTLNEFNESELRLVFDAYNTIRRIG